MNPPAEANIFLLLKAPSVLILCQPVGGGDQETILAILFLFAPRNLFNEFKEAANFFWSALNIHAFVPLPWDLIENPVISPEPDTPSRHTKNAMPTDVIQNLA